MIMTPEQRKELLNGPGLPPPPGVTPNFAHQPNVTFRALNILFLIVTSLFICVRLYVKSRVVRKISLDDCKYFDTSLFSIFSSIGE